MKKRYCAKCKKYYLVGDKCPDCKSKFTLIETKEDKIKIDISGWLYFFIITLFISGGLQFVMALGYENILELIFGFGGASLFILSGLFMSKKRSYALKFTKIVLIVTLIVNIIVTLYEGIEFSPIYFVYFIIWIPYLYSSKQVKQVYGDIKEKPKDYKIWPKSAFLYSFIAPYVAVVFAIISLLSPYKNKKLKILSIIALIVSISIIILTMLGLLLPEEIILPYTLAQDEFEIEQGFMQFLELSLNYGDEINIDLVSKNEIIDFYIMDSREYEAFNNVESFYYGECSKENVAKLTCKQTTPKTDTWYLVFANYGENTAKVSIKLDLVAVKKNE